MDANSKKSIIGFVKGKLDDRDELLDIVNDNDQIVGVKQKSEVYQENKHNFRVINAFIINSEGKLWIPKRSASKILFPVKLDASVGGHVKSGENYEKAFRRELMEELNLDLSDLKYRYLGYLTPAKNNVSAFMKVYEIGTDDVPKYNPKEISEYYWLSPFEVISLVENSDTAKDDLQKLIRIFYL